MVVAPWGRAVAELSGSALDLEKSWTGGAVTKSEKKSERKSEKSDSSSQDTEINANRGGAALFSVPDNLDSVLCSLMMAERTSISSSSSG